MGIAPRSYRPRPASREDEFASALEEVVGIGVQEGVDAVLLAGDVYEHRSVAPEAFRRLPTRTKNGTARRTKDSIPDTMYRGICDSGYPPWMRATTQARPMDVVTGTRNAKNTKKILNRTMVVMTHRHLR